MNTIPSTEDRIWTVLAHLSALSFGMGILLPIVGWSDQRRKSNYASFQCLQALGYQSVGFTVWVLSYLVIIILGSILLLARLGTAAGSNQNTALSPELIIFLVVAFGGFSVYFLLPVIAAVACALGKDFRYPVLGDRLARYLEFVPPQNRETQAWLKEEHEFRWVAAMGHFSILILLWGMLAPLTVWIIQGKNSPFLRFQSIQTLVYQAATTVIFFVGGFLYLFGILLLFATMAGIGAPDLNSTIGIGSFLVLGVSLLIAAVLILIVPLLHILGQWAGYRVLKGEDYKYPFVGGLVERWLARQNLLAEVDGLRSKGTS